MADSCPSQQPAAAPYEPREWRIVYDLAGRDEDALVEQVERLLCGDGHPDSERPCRVEWFSCTPPTNEDEQL